MSDALLFVLFAFAPGVAAGLVVSVFRAVSE